MTEYTTGLIHGLILSVITDVISNFITILIANHIINKKKIGSLYQIIKNIFRRR